MVARAGVGELYTYTNILNETLLKLILLTDIAGNKRITVRTMSEWPEHTIANPSLKEQLFANLRVIKYYNYGNIVWIVRRNKTL